MFVFITCMFVCFLQLLYLLPSLASQKPVLRGYSSRASTPLNQNLCHLCPPYLPISIIAIPSKFMFLSSFRIKLVMWKLVIKALTNLMAHFTFLHLINLNHCAHLCCVYACALWVEVSRTMYHGECFQHCTGTLT